MARPLKKVTKQGQAYVRREAIELEITELEQLNPIELVNRCNLWPKSAPNFVSSEALLYFVRTTNPASEHRESLFRALIRRVQRSLPKPNSGDANSDSLSRTAIRDGVLDRFVDLLLTDQNGYDSSLDYYEVNFNHALASDRLDVSRQVWMEENRTAELMDEEGGVLTEVEQALEHYDPFDPDELDKKDYRRLLDSAIETLPPLQKRIIEMLRLDIPIESNNPDIVTISKVLEKSEKTIRNNRDRAYATLRRRLERKEEM